MNAAADLQARSARPDLFALADDLVESEMIRTGQLTFDNTAEWSHAA